MKTNIVDLLKEICDDFPDHYEKVDLLESQILDSLRLMQLVTAIEEKYETEIEIEDLNPNNFKTVESIVEMMKKYEGMR